MRSVYKILIGKPEGKKHLEDADARCEDNIKTDLNGRMWTAHI
jgi:hypothetical protein